MNLLALPAFTNNYIWMLHDGMHALVVDPGDSAPVLQALDTLQLSLAGILITHGDNDHIDGIDALRSVCKGAIFGPQNDIVPGPYTALQGGDTAELMGLRFDVLDVPGHTAGHIAYFLPANPPAPLLFCGDVLFSGGCGRWRVGTPALAYSSLAKLAQLPGNTRVCGAHEYTLSNLAFARAVEPRNTALQAYTLECEKLRAAHQPTLPSTIERELEINPFLRCDQHGVVTAAMAHSAISRAPHDVFAALRLWKNTF
jgi:hydroxyacylglutathione hydrolase